MYRHQAPIALAVALLCSGCGRTTGDGEAEVGEGLGGVSGQVEEALWAFHQADTARDAESVLALLWPDYSMLVDGARVSYDDVAAGSRTFMPSLALFHTEWTDVQVSALSPTLALTSFQFRDSIVTLAGDLTMSRGPTTFVWEKRGGEWRVLFGDADHYPIER